MTTPELQKLILKTKKENNAVILAHSYVSSDILDIADETGDSFALSRAALNHDENTLIVCGVHFMAETVKLLSPEKRVILANPDAGCPMAEQFTAAEIQSMKKANPDCATVCYINTTADIKSICDVCVTSSTAEKICRSLNEKSILFIPDRNLGGHCAKLISDKQFIFAENGGCPVHSSVTADEAREAKRSHPNALLLCHPECTADVIAYADFVGSTSDITAFTEHSDANEFIIGTELSIREQLSCRFPHKRFYPLSKKLICSDMRLTTLSDVLHALDGSGGLEINMSKELLIDAKKCIDEMLRLGK